MKITTEHGLICDMVRFEKISTFSPTNHNLWIRMKCHNVMPCTTV